MAVINLLEEKSLNRYLQDLVYDGGAPTIIRVENVEIARENIDAIARNILFQYVKRRVRDYSISRTELPCFVKVDKTRSGLPEWTKTTFARGEDIYEFDAGKVPNEFRNELLEIRDYLYSVAVDYIKKELKDVELSNGKKQLRIEYDYLKKNAKYQTIDNVVQQARDWHNELSNNAKNAMTLEQKEKADTGTKFVMDLGNGLSVFQLITPEALDYEGNAMGVCIGDGVYDEGVKKGASQIYSVRNSNGSHATIEVRRNVVHQIKGKANGPVNGKYIKQVREFLKNYLNCAFPNEFTAEERARITNKDLVERNEDGTFRQAYRYPKENPDNKRLIVDTENIGFVEDVHGGVVDMFDLPQDVELKSVPYNLLFTRGIDIKKIKSIHELWARNESVQAIDFKGMDVKELVLYKCKFPDPEYDFNNVDALYLYEDDWGLLTVDSKQFKINPHATKIGLQNVLMVGNYDFSDVKDIVFEKNVWVKDNIIIGPQTKVTEYGWEYDNAYIYRKNGGTNASKIKIFGEISTLDVFKNAVLAIKDKISTASEKLKNNVLQGHNRSDNEKM